MVGMREHIYRLNSAYLIAILAEKSQVSCLSFNIAGNINHLFWLEGCYALEERYVTACSGRVHKDNINLFICLSHTHHKLACIGAEKSDVLGGVEFCIHYGIPDRVLIKLDTDNPLGFIKSYKADCADAAISIKNSLFTCQTCKINGSIIKLFCLYGVNLIK